jgi:hypothetical protein
MATYDAAPSVTGTAKDNIDIDSVVITVGERDYVAEVIGEEWSARVTASLPPGSYAITAKARDGAGNVSTAHMPDGIRIGVPVELTAQPAAQHAYAGDTTVLSVEVMGGISPISYEWWQSGFQKSPVRRGTERALQLAPTTETDRGAYWCVIKDATGTQTSTEPAQVNVAHSPQITRHPSGGTFRAGDDVTLDVEATGGFPPLSYEWRKEGMLAGLDPALILESVSPEDEGAYTVTVRDTIGGGVVTSNPAYIKVTEENMPVSRVAGIAALAILMICGIGRVRR